MSPTSPMSGGAMPRPSEEAKAAFRAALPEDDAIAIRPMFGNAAAFVNGNMFSGLFGEDLLVRLPDDQSRLLLEQGGAPFAPMPGRSMKGYVTLGPAWAADLDSARAWLERALTWTRTLPAKDRRRKSP